jgi:hypothetical protein
MVESPLFCRECKWLYALSVPQHLVDVLGDGNCLFYCMLIYLVQCGLLPQDLVEKCPPGVWMQKTIQKRAELLEQEE